MSGWLTWGKNTIKKAYHRIPWPSMFLKSDITFFLIQNKFWFKWKVSGLSGQKRNNVCIASTIHMLHGLTGLHIQNTHSKKIKNFQIQTTDMKPSTGPSLSAGLRECTRHVPMKLAWMCQAQVQHTLPQLSFPLLAAWSDAKLAQVPTVRGPGSKKHWLKAPIPKHNKDRD